MSCNLSNLGFEYITIGPFTEEIDDIICFNKEEIDYNNISKFLYVINNKNFRKYFLFLFKKICLIIKIFYEFYIEKSLRSFTCITIELFSFSIRNGLK